MYSSSNHDHTLIDPVVVNVAQGALERTRTMREELLRSAEDPCGDIRPLAGTLARFAERRERLATESHGTLKAHRYHLLRHDQLAGVLLAEQCMSALDREFLWYQQIILLATSFAYTAKQLRPGDAERPVLDQVRRSLLSIARH